MSALASLPIDDVLPFVGKALAEQPNLVLAAPTGAGKTTRIPPFLAVCGWADGKSIVVLEPRRIAARAAAARIAEERGGQLGGEVGYSVRFDNRTSSETRILICTEGVFLRLLQSDPFLERVAAVVLDEFHERSIDADLSLSLVRQIQRHVRPDMRIVAMSATLETKPVARFLGGCEIIESKGGLHPIDVDYFGPSGPPDLKTLPNHVRSAVIEALDRTDGDVLVFLPGVGEIRRCEDALSEVADRRALHVAALFGDLPLEAQSLTLRKGSRRKVVLATNVAETSVTVEGVTAVIDSGLARIYRYDHGTGLDRLTLSRISKASAEQRKGRAGRTAPGICLRLWSQRDETAMPERETPEIQRVDLASALLQLHVWGETDVRAFDWFEPPPAAALERADRLLHDLGAVDAAGKLTLRGRRLAGIPTHPRLARLLEAGAELGMVDESAIAAALLGERDPFLKSSDKRAKRSGVSDVAEKVASLQEFRDHGSRFGDVGELVSSSARSVLRVAEHLARSASSIASRLEPGADRMELIARAIFAAYPDRLARRRSPDNPRAVMVGGRGVKLSEQSVVTDEELFVAVELSPIAGGDDLVTAASGVRREWIDPSQLTRANFAEFDAERQRVVTRRQTKYRDLVLEEAPSQNVDPTLAADILVEAAAKDLDRALDLDRSEIKRLRARIEWLRKTMPELEMPCIDDEAIRGLLPQLCIGLQSFEELRESPVSKAIEGFLTQQQRAALHREAPEKLEVPTGSRIALEYAVGMPPVLAVRIQELFGMVETPRIAGGRAPVLLHLLGPNYRPQQVTHDLRSFWTNVYPKIRKELRMKYPKHAWPEDPLTAMPQRKGPSQKR